MVSWYAEQPVITAFSFIGFILATVPLTWQLEGMLQIVTAREMTKQCFLFSSLERGVFALRGLDRDPLFDPIRQPCCVEGGRHQSGTHLVRYRYANISICR